MRKWLPAVLAVLAVLAAVAAGVWVYSTTEDDGSYHVVVLMEIESGEQAVTVSVVLLDFDSAEPGLQVHPGLEAVADSVSTIRINRTAGAIEFEMSESSSHRVTLAPCSDGEYWTTDRTIAALETNAMVSNDTRFVELSVRLEHVSCLSISPYADIAFPTLHVGQRAPHVGSWLYSS